MTAITASIFFLLINYLHYYYLDLLIPFIYYLTLMLFLFLHGQRYREGITKMQESSHSFDHHNQQPIKPKRRTPTAAAATAAAAVIAAGTGNKEIIIWAPDSIKLPEIRHFKKSARTIRRSIKGPHSICCTTMCHLYISFHLTSHHTTQYSNLIYIIF